MRRTWEARWEQVYDQYHANFGKVHYRCSSRSYEAAGSRTTHFTGEEEPSLTFPQAIALANALRAGDLTDYERASSAACVLPRRMAKLMLLMDQSIAADCAYDVPSLARCCRRRVLPTNAVHAHRKPYPCWSSALAGDYRLGGVC